VDERAPTEVTCREFVDLVTDYFEGTLIAATHSLVEEHLVLCDWCVSYADQVQTTMSSLRALREDEAPPEPSDTLLASLRARKEPS
jgi:predicted anti-sigma-YlaC factor YlaD